MISTHAPTQGATAFPCAADFNSRAHARRDVDKAKKAADAFVISTHAPTQGATKMELQKAFGDSISTHAPTQGATLLTKCCASTLSFQLTRPRKARRD